MTLHHHHALLIGTGRRPDEPASIAVTATDAERLAREFIERCCYHADNIIPLVGEQASRAKVLRQLDLLIQKTATERANLVVIFFSGHGLRKGKQFFLVGRDTDKEDIKYTAIEGQVFIEKVNQINAKAILILLNCCHAGALAPEGYESADIPFDKTDFIKTANRVIITACTGTEKAYTSTPLSVFTYALVSGLAGDCIKNNGKNAVTLFDLAMYLRETVVALSHGKQHPELAVLQNSFTANFEVVDYRSGIPAFEKEARGGLYDALGNALHFDPAVPADRDYRHRFGWLENLKNVIIDSEVEIQGNAHIGDEGSSAEEKQGVQNAVIGSRVRVGGDFHLGNKVISHTQNHSGSGDNIAGDKIINHLNQTPLSVVGDNVTIVQDISHSGTGDLNLTFGKSEKTTYDLRDITSQQDTNIGILFYIKNNVRVEHEIQNITAGGNIDIRINQYFQTSPDYQRLLHHVALQKTKVFALAREGGSVYLFESKKLAELEKATIAFKTGALRLADTFLRIEARTERLQQARDLFEQGLILEADKILVETDLIADQDALIAQMDYLQERKALLSAWLEANKTKTG